jgi:sporulation protein YlmC with PRC-barrel domain
MKKWSWLIALLVLVLALSACNAGNDPTTSGDPDADTFPDFAQEVENGVTPMPTQEEVGPGGEIITGEEGLPVDQPEGQTIDSPMMLTSLFVLEVAGERGKVADIEGALLDAHSGMLDYLIVSTHGAEPYREMLLPWGTFYIVDFPGDLETEGMQPAPTVWLTVPDEALAEAPEFDGANLEDPAQLSADWDAETRAYWSAAAPGLPVTGPERMDAPELLHITGGMFGAASVGYPAVDREGERLGAVEDIVLDQQGRALFLILRPAERFNLGNDRIPVAWNAFLWRAGEQEFLLQVSPDMLENAPRLNPDQMPDTSLPGWEDDWQRFWSEQDAGIPPARTPSPEGGSLAVLAGVLYEHPVVNDDGQELGQIADWVIDANGHSDFAILERDGAYIPVPWQLLQWDEEEETITMTRPQALGNGAPEVLALDDLDDAENWHNDAGAYWTDYGYISGSTSPLYARAGQLLQADVLEPDGTPLGAVEDMILDKDMNFPYLVIHANEQFIPVPWMLFDYDAQKDRLLYLDDTERLEEAPGFSDLEEFDAASETWYSQIRTYWGME